MFQTSCSASEGASPVQSTVDIRSVLFPVGRSREESWGRAGS